MKARNRFFQSVSRLCKLEQGAIRPLWLQILYALLHPMLFAFWLIQEKGPVRYDWSTDVFEIYGTRYSGELLRDFGKNGMSAGVLFRIRKRRNKTLILERMEENQE